MEKEKVKGIPYGVASFEQLSSYVCNVLAK